MPDSRDLLAGWQYLRNIKLLNTAHCFVFLFLLGATYSAARADFEAGLAAYVVGDYEKAAIEFRILAEDGFPPAQYNLAQMYRLGQGMSPDVAEAIQWYRRAADKGHGEAQYSLGVIYDEGVGVPANAAEALKWYRQGARQGIVDAEYNIGILYRNGRGVEQDITKAYAWLDHANHSGDLSAGTTRDALATDMSEREIEQGRRLSDSLFRDHQH